MVAVPDQSLDGVRVRLLPVTASDIEASLDFALKVMGSPSRSVAVNSIVTGVSS